MKVLFTLFALIFSNLIFAKPLSNFVVFGDSLSDNGNLYEYMQRKVPPSPPYYDGHFTNGPIWIEYLASSYFPNKSNDHLLNYAYGGAGVADDEVLFTLKREIDMYLSSHDNKADENSLFVIWIGANNYLGVPDDTETALAEVNSGIEKSLKHLVEVGAKQILVLNLPNLGLTPLAAAMDADSRETLTYLSKRHNELLEISMSSLKQANPEIQWLYFDANSNVQKIIDTPGNYGFTNITGTCYDMIVEKPARSTVLDIATSIKLNTEADNCDGYLFFDPVHPTAPAHKIVADEARLFLDAAGVEFVKE